MRSVDPTESFAPLGKAIPAPAPPAPAPKPEGASGIITSNGMAQTTSHPKPEVKAYGDILDTQGMIHRDSFPKWAQTVVLCGDSFVAPSNRVEHNEPTELKWVGEAADAWRGIHAQQADDYTTILEQYYARQNAQAISKITKAWADQVDEWVMQQFRDMSRKADRD